MKRHVQRSHAALQEIPNPVPNSANAAELPEEVLSGGNDDIDDEPNADDGLFEDEGHGEDSNFNITQCAAAFLSQIKASDSVTLSTVNKVVDNVTFMEGALRDIKERTVNTLKELGIDSDNTVIQELLSKIDAYSDPFKGLKSPSEQTSYFKSSGALIPPTTVPLGQNFRQKLDKCSGTVLQIPVQDTCQYVPISPVMKAVLQCPGGHGYHSLL